jgi:Icc-related predicted phosphoesterase
MMKLVFCTDLHLNHIVEERIINSFVNEVLGYEPSALVIAGDISEAPSLERHLNWLESHLNIPIYFVCGNHDYYRGSIETLRLLLTQKFQRWLPITGVVTLAPNIGLIGHDGWYDGGYANWFESKVILNDYHLIEEFSVLTEVGLFSAIQQLAREGEHYFQTWLPQAFENHDIVFLVTHVAPWPENALTPEGTPSDDQWLPCFSSKASGDAIQDIMEKMPNKKLIVLCGHSHTYAKYQPLPNILAITGKGEYGKCYISEVFDLNFPDLKCDIVTSFQLRRC